jgi:cysteine desulfurase
LSPPVYLDYNATTPVHPDVLSAMLPCFSENFGNASSATHAHGWRAKVLVEKSREEMAAFIGSEPGEIIFTSGSTEAINLALKGVFQKYSAKGKHIIAAETEHKAVLDTLTFLEKYGEAEITLLRPDTNGIISVPTLEKALRSDTILVCIMLANNETGVIQDLKSLSEATHKAGSIFFSDTTQAAGKIDFKVNELGIDLCCVSAHKMYGPKGAGALFVRRKNPRVQLFPLFHGGGHEKELRSGTLNVPGIVGMGAATKINLPEKFLLIEEIRNRLEEKLLQSKKIRINGKSGSRLPNTSSITIQGIKADSLIKSLRNFSFSTGSACTSAIPEPSHVLLSMGLSPEECFSSIRISLGIHTTEKEAEDFAEELLKIVV